jgi:hypothetical protein
MLASLAAHVGATNLPTRAIGLSAAAFLFWVRRGLKPTLVALGLRPYVADLLAKTGPVVAIAVSTLAAWRFDLQAAGVAIVGDTPLGLPRPSLPIFDAELWLALAGPAALISLVGFVESVSVAQTLAAKRRQRIRPDQELIGLGASNVAAAVSGGYPMTGGFARSVVNFDAGAETPAAGAFAAAGIALATLTLTPLLHFLPKAVLARRSSSPSSASSISASCAAPGPTAAPTSPPLRSPSPSRSGWASRRASPPALRCRCCCSCGARRGLISPRWAGCPGLSISAISCAIGWRPTRAC